MFEKLFFVVKNKENYGILFGFRAISQHKGFLFSVSENEFIESILSLFSKTKTKHAHNF